MIRDYTSGYAGTIASVWKVAPDVAHLFLASDSIDPEADIPPDIYLAQTRVPKIEGLFHDRSLDGDGIGRAIVDDAAQIRDALEVEILARNTVCGKSYEPRSLRKIRETLFRATGEAVMRFGYSQITEAAAA